jgi:hypothetical protein
VRRQPEPARQEAQDPDLPTVQIQVSCKAHLPDAMMHRAGSGGRFNGTGRFRRLVSN